ncbi:flagellar basal body protein [Giesbergeria anulus]|uniref:Flagella basal body rod protein n=1 Tax=Giesbergeria anulus TaxID=180197 RepID=A0A1H9PZ90_9BURK|nr:flagellar basal body protein [Giesbergeria anulus]SER53537.1 Flagella basal body rod protein [Giesbergeria anulus]
MASISSIGSSGMQAAQMRLDASAHNVANANTPNYRRTAVEQEAAPDNGGTRARMERQSNEKVALEKEAVEQISATYSFAANLLSVKTEGRLMGTLLDERA